MALSESEIRKYSARVYMSKLRLLYENGFYGVLLSHMKFSIDEECDTAYTDGERIAFSPKFMDELNDSELDFVLMHEVLHVALLHCFRTGDRQSDLFNIACDIVVNSNIKHSKNDKDSDITLRKYGVAMHLTPDGKEGYEFTAEEVYEMLVDHCKKNNLAVNPDANTGFDRHDRWNKPKKGNNKGDGNSSPVGGVGDAASVDDDGYLSDLWKQRVAEAAEAAKTFEGGSKNAGNLPAGIERMIYDLTHPKLNWRQVLCDFVSEEITDYSFFPPDRRFSESDFFLPDLNEKDDRAENILFMVDTSGSMSDKMIAEIYSELKGAIDQFGGKLSGWLGFFDWVVYEPIPFDSVNELLSIRPKGGGGTNFDAIFEYVSKQTEIEEIAAIVTLTDGYCSFPEESAANGIPVLWIINSDVTAPWGQSVKI